MKSDIHPEYRPVVFQDQSSGTNFLVRSTIDTPDTIELEGQTYPLAKLEISSASHPFFTGQMKIVDTAGRVERFERRYGRARKVEDEGAAPAAAAAPDAPKAEAPTADAPKAEAPKAEAPEAEAPEAEAPVETAAAPEAPAEAEAAPVEATTEEE